MIGTLLQNIVGGIVFVTTLGIYLESINPDAFPGIWKTIFYVYPIERVAIAVISAVVAAPIIRSIKPLLSNFGESKLPSSISVTFSLFLNIIMENLSY